MSDALEPIAERLIQPYLEDFKRRTGKEALLKTRIRGPEYLTSYWNEFTVRSGRPGDRSVEDAMDKDLFLYGFRNLKSDGLAFFSLIDLREHCRELKLGNIEGRLRSTSDADFLIYDLWSYA